MTQDFDEFMKNAPADVRERLMAMPPEERQRRFERRRQMMESMDPEAREEMMRFMRIVRERPSAPDVGSPAPDFELPVLHGDGERMRLHDLRGRPVGLVFGSYT